MGLVDYSDSETSEVEETTTTTSRPTPTPTRTNRSEAKKIRVELPSIKPEPAQADGQERPAKRAKTAGVFGGFNSLLPAPKGTATSGPKPGVSLKTSSEAAFSRAPVSHTEELPSGHGNGGQHVADGEGDQGSEAAPMIVGKATRFKPLSVANSKKKPVKKPKPPEDIASKDAAGDNGTKLPSASESRAETGPRLAFAEKAAAPKPKTSLFSIDVEKEATPAVANGDSYESIAAVSRKSAASQTEAQSQPDPSPSDPNSLHSLASNLNLTPAQRRQLFGRHANKDSDINIAHFNMDSEYAANEQARQAGEVVEHRAVKAIAPGKHSLQQLVNNARTQQGAMEDKWADGRRERGEAGGKYGWGK